MRRKADAGRCAGHMAEVVRILNELCYCYRYIYLKILTPLIGGISVKMTTESSVNKFIPFVSFYLRNRVLHKSEQYRDTKNETFRYL